MIFQLCGILVDLPQVAITLQSLVKKDLGDTRRWKARHYYYDQC